MFVLHGLVLLGFLLSRPPNPPVPPPLLVRVSQLPPPPPAHVSVPQPRLSTEPVIVAIAPSFSVAPPPDLIRPAPSAPPTPPGDFAPAPPPKPPAPPLDYLSQLVAHLNTYKIYPYAARSHREEGIVRLRFSLDREGHVLSFAVVGSSGSAALDEEARAMIQRADPFPPAPPQFRGDTLDLVVPVVFSLH